MALPLRRLLLSQEPPVEVRTGRAARHTEAEARGIIKVALPPPPSAALLAAPGTCTHWKAPPCHGAHLRGLWLLKLAP
jgi:hypothetical protein